MGSDGDTFREAFLQANARPDFISGEFAEALRYLIRAVAADDSSGALYSASEKTTFLMDLIQRCPEGLSWYSIFSEAVGEIKEAIPQDTDDRRYVHAARRGMKYFVELSSNDGFASARASKAYDGFCQAMRWSDEARQLPRR